MIVIPSDWKTVTIWLLSRQPTGTIRGETAERELILNHLEDGHVDRDTPNPQSAAQQKWVGGAWVKEYGYLTPLPSSHLVRKGMLGFDDDGGP